MILGLLALALVFVTTPVGAIPYVYTSPIDSIVALGTGMPDEATEKGYLATYLSLTVAQVEALYDFEKNEGIGTFDYKDLSFGYDPGFAWDYAIVKVDGKTDKWYLFMDDNATGFLTGGNNVLTTPAAGEEVNKIFNQGRTPKGISHISWFKTKEEPPGKVPEPTTLILLGMGLIGVAGIRRKMK